MAYCSNIEQKTRSHRIVSAPRLVVLSCGSSNLVGPGSSRALVASGSSRLSVSSYSRSSTSHLPNVSSAPALGGNRILSVPNRSQPFVRSLSHSSSVDHSRWKSTSSAVLTDLGRHFKPKVNAVTREPGRVHRLVRSFSSSTCNLESAASLDCKIPSRRVLNQKNRKYETLDSGCETRIVLSNTERVLDSPTKRDVSLTAITAEHASSFKVEVNAGLYQEEKRLKQNEGVLVEKVVTPTLVTNLPASLSLLPCLKQTYFTTDTEDTVNIKLKREEELSSNGRQDCCEKVDGVKLARHECIEFEKIPQQSKIANETKDLETNEVQISDHLSLVSYGENNERHEDEIESTQREHHSGDKNDRAPIILHTNHPNIVEKVLEHSIEAPVKLSEDFPSMKPCDKFIGKSIKSCVIASTINEVSTLEVENTTGNVENRNMIDICKTKCSVDQNSVDGDYSLHQVRKPLKVLPINSLISEPEKPTPSSKAVETDDARPLIANYETSLANDDNKPIIEPHFKDNILARECLNENVIDKLDEAATTKVEPRCYFNNVPKIDNNKGSLLDVQKRSVGLVHDLNSGKLDEVQLFSNTSNRNVEKEQKKVKKVRKVKLKKRCGVKLVESRDSGSITKDGVETGKNEKLTLEQQDKINRIAKFRERGQRHKLTIEKMKMEDDPVAYMRNDVNIRFALRIKQQELLKRQQQDNAENGANKPAEAELGGILDYTLDYFPSHHHQMDFDTQTSSISPLTGPIPKYKSYSLDDFTLIRVLGRGGFGKVILAKMCGTENYFAVKCLKKSRLVSDEDFEDVTTEQKVLTLATNHPFLCHLFCTFQTYTHLFFVLEFLNGGDLSFHLHTLGKFTTELTRFYAAEIVCGLKFLHKKGIIYRDLKLDNVLLDYQGHVRLADFGMCITKIFLDRTANSFCGTVDYMAPEVILGQCYNQLVDWWSFGILLYEMLVGLSPFFGLDEQELFLAIRYEEPYYPKFLSKNCVDIIKWLLKKDCNQRLGSCESPAGHVSSQPFFGHLDWSAVENKRLRPPLVPQLKSSSDCRYFDEKCSSLSVLITEHEEEVHRDSTDHQYSRFKNFVYTNPNLTD